VTDSDYSPVGSREPERRVTPKELKQVISRLRRNLKRELRRAEKVKELKKEINTLALQIQGLRFDPELR